MIACEVRQKTHSCLRREKEAILFTAMDRKAISERLETFINEKNHIAMQITPPKQKKIICMAHKTENQPFFPNFTQISAQPTSTYFISPSLVFQTDAISVKISRNAFRDLEILYDMQRMLITRKQRLKQTVLG